ncbi:UNVERIFIED_CONTAM: hypothetical protein Sradi_4879500 [Sesamum radiatum]|uniref:Uncharacterized protein n=1 Tax=Sesamum radiatum TaxID=300843 RepID=A0AAW2MZR9_SESRA
MPMFAEGLDSHTFVTRSQPQLASLPPCILSTISEPVDASLDATEHPRSASALRHSPYAYNAHLKPNIQSVHPRCTPLSWPSSIPCPSRTAS